MKLTQQYDIETDRTIWTLTFERRDFLNLNLDGFDKMLLDECGKSEKVSDLLLGLETIARRVEESNAPNRTPSS